MNKFLAVLLMVCATPFASADSGGGSKWNGPALALNVSADDSAYIDTGCGSYSIPAGQWRTDGTPMSAIARSGVPMHNAPLVHRTITATLLPNGQLQLEIEKQQPMVLDAGAGQPFPHCLASGGN